MKKRYCLFTLLLAFAISLGGCQKEEGPMEKFGKKMDETAEEAEDTVKDAAKEVEKEVEKLDDGD
jgi:hypothetical protein